MSKNVLGFVLIDAPHSALNNAGKDDEARTENTVDVKVIRKGRSVYPYVSAQAWRYWWRNALKEKYSWNMSEITHIKKSGGKGNQAFTAANPFTCEDDDIFGYMRASKKDEKGTLTRLSPLKNSPLISVISHAPTDDYGSMSRHEGDPVPFTHQFYSTILKGIFSLDLNSMGIFYESARTGFKNLDDEHLKIERIKSAKDESEAVKENGSWKLPKPERVKRARETISVLPYLYSTTKSAGHLTDVTPKFIVLAVIDGGNHIFMNIANESYDKPVNVKALRQVLSDYSGNIVSDIYIGRQEGFMDELDNDLKGLNFAGKTVHCLSPKQAVEEFVKTIENHIE
ncbi:MAG: type I-B CRISPR-associated protein Cas7/Cst2/DevR [Nitrospirae bacterium]|nr:type I-B CRISPR-associated protein Cas7/Cst2/DevR [Nitrospirota bacterium]